MRGRLFCNLPDERIIDQCDHTLTVRDGFPVSPRHTLVIPKHHVATFFDTMEEEQMAISLAIQKASKVLDQEFTTDGYNIGINNGEVAGQTVFHLHVHLIPRYKGDCEDQEAYPLSFTGKNSIFGIEVEQYDWFIFA